ncbi:RibD family protein [Paralimibaculum aggregatum]|uniref:RibD family protein n=1 Tax=Paralimibaculum aggregatum TaxID=3036245 RepID=A0ABQ6LDK6_9RHOB|nr:RibD family protein [Limibaculum sp. NKW23]GMG81027.1 RibD family protein [Limibaculum sp. NKW23]
MLLDAKTATIRHRASDYDAAEALAGLAPRERDRPVVIGQLGQSLDGRIATPAGESKYINGHEALRHLHRLRAKVDVVLVGVGTAIADDPQLTTRHVPGPNPVRVVIDPRGRMPADLAMLHDGAGPVIAITLPGVAVPAGVEALALCGDETGSIPPASIVAALAARGMASVLVEGGAETLARFLDAGAVDELHLMVAPIVLGSGKTGLNLAPIETLDEAMRPEVLTMRFRDGDMLCLCDLSRERAAMARRCPLTAAS